MKKIEQFQITSLNISGFKSYEDPTELVFGNPTVITGGNGRGKTSIADAIAFVVTGLPFFGERGIDRLHNESNPDVAIRMCFVDETGAHHELTRTRRKSRMTISYDGYEIRQLDLNDMFGERDVFLSILNPLYFIEELGEDGKNLLEMYLPMIPHETVLAQLSEPVREALKNESLLSPDVYLKRRREEIRGLEERITYLGGQKDLAESQNKSHGQAQQDLKNQLEALREEIAALECKQFSGMNTTEMQARLVELSQRYDEAARDERSDAAEQRNNLHALREKIARRQAEQYQSKFTQPLANIAAKVKELGTRYTREVAALKAFHAGMECPTCHRPVTAESLPEVQTALKKVISGLYTAGTEQQSQLAQLQEMDKKAADTFEQFKADDLTKWQADAADLEKLCQELSGNVSKEVERLRMEIQTLSAELDYGNLTQEEYDRLGVCREEYRQCEAKLAALETVVTAELPNFDQEIAQARESIAETKRIMADVVSYICKRAELTFSQLKMNKVEISLYDVVKSTGEAKDTFKFTYGGRRYDRLSLSEKIRAGMEVSELMKRLTGRNYPVFVDNMESVDDLANIDLETFVERKTALSDQQTQLRAEYQKAETDYAEKKQEFERLQEESRQIADYLSGQFLPNDKVLEKMYEAIDRVTIHSANEIEIRWKFEDLFQNMQRPHPKKQAI